MEDKQFERARERVLWYLDRSDRTEKELRDRLKRGEFSPEIIDAVLSRLKEVGIVDDRRYAIRYAERLAEKNVSKRESYAKMMAKGISRDIITETLHSVEADEGEQIAALISKKYASRLQSEDGVRKVYAALLRKGFSYSAVRDALKKYSEELEYMGE